MSCTQGRVQSLSLRTGRRGEKDSPLQKPSGGVRCNMEKGLYQKDKRLEEWGHPLRHPCQEATILPQEFRREFRSISYPILTDRSRHFTPGLSLGGCEACTSHQSPIGFKILARNFLRILPPEADQKTVGSGTCPYEECRPYGCDAHTLTGSCHGRSWNDLSWDVSGSNQVCWSDSANPCAGSPTHPAPGPNIRTPSNEVPSRMM